MANQASPTLAGKIATGKRVKRDKRPLWVYVCSPGLKVKVKQSHDAFNAHTLPVWHHKKKSYEWRSQAWTYCDRPECHYVHTFYERARFVRRDVNEAKFTVVYIWIVYTLCPLTPGSNYTANEDCTRSAGLCARALSVQCRNITWCGTRTCTAVRLYFRSFLLWFYFISPLFKCALR